MSPPWVTLPVICRKIGVIHADIFIILEICSLWTLFKQKFCQYLGFGLISRSSQFCGFLNAQVLVMQLQKTDFTIIEIMAFIPTGNYHETTATVLSEKIKIIKLPKVV